MGFHLSPCEGKDQNLVTISARFDIFSRNYTFTKINAFFGYEFIKEVRLVLVREKIDINLGQNFGNNQTSKYRKKIEKMGNNQLKKNLDKLIDVFTNKKV